MAFCIPLLFPRSEGSGAVVGVCGVGQTETDLTGFCCLRITCLVHHGLVHEVTDGVPNSVRCLGYGLDRLVGRVELVCFLHSRGCINSVNGDHYDGMQLRCLRACKRSPKLVDDLQNLGTSAAIPPKAATEHSGHSHRRPSLERQVLTSGASSPSIGDECSSRINLHLLTSWESLLPQFSVCSQYPNNSWLPKSPSPKV
jgi:hypothetical protein